MNIIAQIFFGGFAVYAVYSELYRRRNELSFILTIWKRFRFGMFLQTFILALTVISTFVFLNRQSAFFHYGWLHIIFENGGNIILAPIVSGSQSTHLAIRLLTPVFLYSLILVLPFFAQTEENCFRRGYHTMSEIILQSVYFGLVHLVVGISLSIAVALIIPGFFFAYKYENTYRKLSKVMSKKEASNEAILVSTTYYVMMNTIIIGYLAILCILCI